MVPDQINTYLEELIPERIEEIKEMETYAKENHVPIMDLVSVEAILQLLRIVQPAKILEIGTAIGYSAIRMAKALPHTKIVTLERNTQRYESAIQNIDQTKSSGQIEVLFGDALELVEPVKDKGVFDVIFIDAAKGQYKRFFESFETVLADEGIIITDNVLFKGLVAEPFIENKRRRQLVDKIKMYNEWIMSHPGYTTTILPIGDGIAISKKRGVSNEEA